MSYRLLDNGEIMHHGDEFFSIEGNWVAIHCESEGKVYNGENKRRLPVRRKISDTSETEKPAANTGSPKLPTLEEIQQAVIDAQLCTHSEVEVPVLVKWVYDYICRQLQAGA